MNKPISILLLLICVFVFKHNVNAVHPIKNQINLIVDSHIKFIEENYGWPLQCRGGGIPKKITFVRLGFIVPQTCDIETARNYLIIASQDLLTRINEEKSIQEHLISSPFKIKNIEYSLLFKGELQNSINNNKSLYYVFLCNDNIFYSILDEDNNMVDIHKETYQEAMNIFNQSKT